MAQIGKDYYEDLTAEGLGKIIDELAAGRVPVPGPQNGRYAAEPLSGLTSLVEHDSGKTQYNASAQLAVDLGETVKRIDGTEVPILTPWLDRTDKSAGKAKGTKAAAKSAAKVKAPAKSVAATKPAAKAKASAKPAAQTGAVAEKKPRTMTAPRKAGADNLKLISGVGPKLEQTLNELGFWHFDQIAKWTGDEIAWVDSRLKFKGRIERDDWMAQASILAAGGETEFSKKSKK